MYFSTMYMKDKEVYIYQTWSLSSQQGIVLWAIYLAASQGKEGTDWPWVCGCTKREGKTEGIKPMQFQFIDMLSEGARCVSVQGN